MGICIQTLKLFKDTHNKYGDFGKTLTIGRQGNHFPKQAIEAIFGDKNYIETPFCEELLMEYLGATSVDSLDYSNYEGATIIADMNEPLTITDKFDTIIDGGSLEHIYQLPQALYNISKVCKVDGTILHIVPSNNQCGHGFYQFSPELFFSLYSEKNGYTDTEIFLADTTDPNWTYKIELPKLGERHDIRHPNPISIMVRTKLTTEYFTHKNVQQSDYSYIWKQS